MKRLRAALARRAAAWARRRQGADVAPVTLHGRRIYILPTRAGLGFAALLFLMLLAGLNYQNSLALFLTFLLAGLALVAMHLCHRNLLGARITAIRAAPAFAGSAARVEIDVDVTGGAARHAWSAHIDAVDGPPASLDPLRGGRIAIDVPTTRRGIRPVDRVRIATDFPFGLFRAWTWLHLPLDLVVYPRPAGDRVPSASQGTPAGDRAIDRPGEDEWHDLRAFRDGDSPRNVAWKVYARGGPLVVKEYAASGVAAEVYDFDALLGLDAETRLSQLAAWLLAAHERGARFGVRVRGEAIPLDAGAAHLHRCLAVLARFEGA
jgi:uncharacterized protein (DUF58 family)